MFKTKEKRYMTKGVDNQIPKKIQYRCWQLIDQAVSKGEYELDYLQIFEFNRDDQRQSITIIHSQEQPFAIKYHEFKITQELIDFRIKELWVIDDETCQTMLLPEEY